jgi:hypothetical protein
MTFKLKCDRCGKYVDENDESMSLIYKFVSAYSKQRNLIESGNEVVLGNVEVLDLCEQCSEKLATDIRNIKS